MSYEFEMHPIEKKYPVCDLNELKVTNSLGTDIAINDSTVQCFLIYHKDKIFSYINSCPHTGVTLNWQPHQFLDNENKFIQCGMHGALFNIDDGLCVHGPCIGERLKMVKNEVLNNKIYLIL